MKAAVLTALGAFTIEERELPKVGVGGVRVRVEACGVCPSDLRVFRGGHARVRLPHVLGHEVVGLVEEVGEGTQGYRPGDRVSLVPRISCGQCSACRKNLYSHCPNARTVGFDLPGGFAEQVLIPAPGAAVGILIPVGAGVSSEEAALTEPLACCVRAQKSMGVGAGDVVAVLGGGPIGTLHGLLARARGARRILLIERDRGRIAQAAAFGWERVVNAEEEDAEEAARALTEGRGADVVVVAASVAEAQAQALSLAGPRGRVCFFAGLPRGTPPHPTDTNRIHYMELRVEGSHGSSPEENREAAELLASGKVPAKDLLTHRFPLDRTQEAFEAVERREGMKVVILPGAAEGAS